MGRIPRDRPAGTRFDAPRIGRNGTRAFRAGAGSVPAAATQFGSVEGLVMDTVLVELEADHPGFNDPEYRRRRNEIAAVAVAQRPEETPARIAYTATERSTWRTVFEHLARLYPTHACREYNAVFGELGYRPGEIPQLADVSAFLGQRTGFRLRPVAGLVSARDFLAGLAGRVFCATQYIRHHSKPHYTPEPDVVHELLGHAPMLAIPEFAYLSQAIGRASLGASDEAIERLATLYWFTVEYGVVRQDGALRAYGAGLLSSFGELEHALAGGPEIRPFDPAEAALTPYPITTFQPLLWEVPSIGEAFARIETYLA